MIFGLWTTLGGHGAPGIELAYNVRAPEDIDALLARCRPGRWDDRPSGGSG
jgi:hypothetical protein